MVKTPPQSKPWPLPPLENGDRRLWLAAEYLLAESMTRVLAVLQEGVVSPEHAAFLQQLANTAVSELGRGDRRYVEQPADFVTQRSFSRRRKVPSALAASIPLNAVWIRPANLRTIPFGRVCHFGDYVGYAGGMTAQSTYSI